MSTNWKTVRLRAGAFIVVACAAAISFTSSKDLAVMAKFGWLAWLFPVCLDAVAAVALDIWIRHSAAQRIAGWLGMAAIMLSTASNGADHYLSTGMVLAAVLGVVPPAMLAWMLLVLHRHAAPVVLLDGLARGTTEPVPVVPERSVPTYSVPLVPVEPTSTTVAPQDQPVPITIPRGPIEYRSPVPPETDAEKTMVMAPIGRKVTEPGETRTKVVPATRTTTSSTARLASVPTGRALESNQDLAKKIAETGTVPARRELMKTYGIGTGRATAIQRLAEEMIAS